MDEQTAEYIGDIIVLASALITFIGAFFITRTLSRKLNKKWIKIICWFTVFPVSSYIILVMIMYAIDISEIIPYSR